MSKRKTDLSLILKISAIPLVVVVGIAALLIIKLALPAPAKDTPVVDVPRTNVTVMTVEPIAEFEDTVSLKSIIEPWAVIEISAEVAGRIEAIYVAEGDKIAPGQKLVELERDLLEAEYAQARAQAQFDEREVERVEAAAQRGGAASAMEVDMARSNAAASEARMKYRAAQLRRTEIVSPAVVANRPNPAPIIGTVSELPVEVGEYLQPGMPVVTIIDLTDAKVIVDMPEKDIRYFRVGDEAAVQIDALGSPGEPYEATGTVHFINPSADPATRTFRVELRLPNPDGLIRAGMIATVQMKRRTLNDVIMVPLAAVIPLERGYEVYVAEDDVARSRQVRLGLLRGTRAQLLPVGDRPFLKAGDQLIVEGQRFVTDGQPVLVRPEPEQMLQEAKTSPAASQPATGPAPADNVDIDSVESGDAVVEEN